MTSEQSGDGERSSPRVSVVIPVYDGAKHLRAAVECMLQQTLTDIEVIVVDDGSTDETPEVLRSFMGVPRLRVITHVTNLGLVASLNAGIEAAQAPLIARMDADDWSAPTRLARQVALFDSDPRMVLSATHFAVVDAAGGAHRVIPTFGSRGRLMLAMAAFNCIGHSTAMFRKDVVERAGGYRAEWMPGEDYDLWLRLLPLGSVGVVPSVEVRYLDNPNGISHRMTAMLTDHGQRLAARWLRTLAGDGDSERDDGDQPMLVTVRQWGRASRRVRRNLRAEDSTVREVRMQGLLGAMRVVRGQNVLVRHLVVAGLCPILYVGGQVERLLRKLGNSDPLRQSEDANAPMVA